MTKNERQFIFNKYHGRCAYCGCELEKGWHVDHIEPIVRDSKWNKNKGRYEQTGTCRKPENDFLENYNPSCASCNIQKNSYTIEQFRNNIKQFINSLNQYSTQYKFAKRYGLVSETGIEVKFYFEKINDKDCMSWKDIEKELPPPKLKVQLSYGIFGIRGSVCDSWISEGWILPSGTWSVEWKEGMPKFPKPTHWKYIESKLFES